LGEIKHQPLLTLFLLAVPISMIHQFYFVHTSGFLTELQVREEAASKRRLRPSTRSSAWAAAGSMTVGQMMEMIVLAPDPVLRQEGFPEDAARRRYHRLRPPHGALRVHDVARADHHRRRPARLLLRLLHLRSFMVVDEETSKDVRASAQNLFNLVVMGPGHHGRQLVRHLRRRASGPKVDGKTDYTRLFSVPMWMSVACLALLMLFYRGGKKIEAKTV
jgi:hypothetical protein